VAQVRSAPAAEPHSGLGKAAPEASGLGRAANDHPNSQAVVKAIEPRSAAAIATPTSIAIPTLISTMIGVAIGTAGAIIRSVPA
jgi:hypothetical protein